MSLTKIFIALDNFSTREEICQFVEKCEGRAKHFKIGLETFYAHGKKLVDDLVEHYDLQIFLDLKLYDIPNTMGQAIRALQGMPIHFLSVHLSAGETALKQSLQQAQISLPKTKLVGISYLTSFGEKDFDQLWALTTAQEREKAFIRLFNLAQDVQIPSVVLSGHELPKIGKRPFLKICPGIRFAEESLQDQQRVLTPESAFSLGADYLVMGRSLTQAKNLHQRLDQLEAL